MEMLRHKLFGLMQRPVTEISTELLTVQLPGKDKPMEHTGSPIYDSSHQL